MKKLAFLLALVAGIYQLFLRPNTLQSQIPYKLVFVERVFGTSDAKQLPMVLVFHGAGAHEKDLLPIFSESAVSPLRVISFRAPKRIALFSYNWPLEDEKLIESIAIGTAELQRRYPTVGKPVLFGFSRGGELLYKLVAAYSERYAAAFIFGGPVSISLEHMLSKGSVPELPIHVYHGKDDPLIPIDPARAWVQQLTGAGLKVHWHEFEGEHGITYRMQKSFESELKQLLN